jgi:hypothetical protein
MNSATLETMQRIIEQICPPKPTNWIWRGKDRKSVRFGLTEVQARSLQLQYGGETERQA